MAGLAETLAKMQQQQVPTPHVTKIVLTGGPCGGKSSALSLISQRLESMGLKVYLVPEAASILFTGGGRFEEWNTERCIAFEENKTRVQMALEDTFYNLAAISGKQSIIVCDRGTMDSKAYVDNTTWNKLLDKTGWTSVDLREKRYDIVIHMSSTAIGAEQFYGRHTNDCRSESLEEARKVDRRILRAWTGHPRLFIVDNRTDWAGKMERVLEIICRQIGLPKPGAVRKFFVRDSSEPSEIPVKYEEFLAEQTFLVRGQGKTPDKDGYVFIYKRGRGKICSYRYSAKYNFSNGQSAIVERQISEQEYITLLDQADPSRSALHKQVKCFVWQNRYFALARYVKPNNGLTLLYTSYDQTDMQLPPFLEVTEEVTNDPEYSSYHLAGVAAREEEESMK